MKRRTVFIALFAALICVSSFWSIPLLPGIPIVLKNMVVVLAGALLGTWYGMAASALYLLTGILGLPVFANAGGIAAFLSPAGGYLIGYPLGSLVTGLVAGRPSVGDRRRRWGYCARIVLALFLGFLTILVCGALHLVYFNSLKEEPRPAPAVFAGGIVPFALADTIKLVLAAPIALALRPVTARYLGRDEGEREQWK